MKISFPCFVLVTVLPLGLVSLSAAPPARDLGQGLSYHRVQALPADLPTIEAPHKQPRVVDLRYAGGDASAGTALSAWLKFNATSQAPVFLLVNADTSAALLAPLAAPHPGAGLVVIGTASPGLTPDLTLKIDPAGERRAYDALTTGASIDSLLNDNPEKSRDDEARLVKDYARRPDPAGPLNDDFIDSSSPAATNPEKATPPKPMAPPIDFALQRAVHLHRALKALNRL